MDIRSFSGRGGRCFRIFGWFLSGNHPEKKHSLNLKALKLSVQLGRATILTLCGAGCWNSWCSCRKNKIRWYGLWMICGLAKWSGVERTLRLHSKQMVVVGNSFLKMTQQFWFGSTNSKNYPTYNLISWICHLICNPIWYRYIFTYRWKWPYSRGNGLVSQSHGSVMGTGLLWFRISFSAVKTPNTPQVSHKKPCGLSWCYIHLQGTYQNDFEDVKSRFLTAKKLENLMQEDHCAWLTSQGYICSNDGSFFFAFEGNAKDA